jgi:hypothetical protein
MTDKKIGLAEVIILTLLVVPLDILEMILGLVPGLSYLLGGYDLAVLVGLSLYFYMKGGGYMLSMIANGTETLFAGLDALPIRTVALYVSIYQTNHQDKKASKPGLFSKLTKGKMELAKQFLGGGKGMPGKQLTGGKSAAGSGGAKPQLLGGSGKMAAGGASGGGAAAARGAAAGGAAAGGAAAGGGAAAAAGPWGLAALALSEVDPKELRRHPRKEARRVVLSLSKDFGKPTGGGLDLPGGQSTAQPRPAEAADSGGATTAGGAAPPPPPPPPPIVV